MNTANNNDNNNLPRASRSNSADQFPIKYSPSFSLWEWEYTGGAEKAREGSAGEKVV